MLLYFVNLKCIILGDAQTQAESTERIYYENFDLETIITPVNVEQLVQLLNEVNYNKEEVLFLENGFKNGFDLGYEGPMTRQSIAANIPFTVGNKQELWSKIMREVKLKRVAGPFKTVPFNDYVQSPIGLVPKAGSGDQTCLIFHLSYNNKEDGLGSVNSAIPKNKCSVKYRDVDYAVNTYLHHYATEGSSDQRDSKEVDPDTVRKRLSSRWKDEFDANHVKKKDLMIFAGKTDLKSAFRILGLSRESWRWLIMCTEDPATGTWYYFIDKCLPFGAISSCAIFQRFSDALQFLIEHKANVVGCVTNYLDDFLFIALTLIRCNQLINGFLLLCNEIGVPISAEKTVWGTDLIVFLGILLDGRNLILAIPNEKCERAL